MKRQIKKDRKEYRAPSFFHSVKEAMIMVTLMINFTVLPFMFLFIYADKLGVWWIIILLIYCLILIVLIYLIYQYRTLIEIRGYFTDEEFAQKYPKDDKLLKFLDKYRRFLIN